MLCNVHLQVPANLMCTHERVLCSCPACHAYLPLYHPLCSCPACHSYLPLYHPLCRSEPALFAHSAVVDLPDGQTPTHPDYSILKKLALCAPESSGHENDESDEDDLMGCVTALLLLIDRLQLLGTSAESTRCVPDIQDSTDKSHQFRMIVASPNDRPNPVQPRTALLNPQ